jgi:hypothetical protein
MVWDVWNPAELLGAWHVIPLEMWMRVPGWEWALKKLQKKKPPGN